MSRGLFDALAWTPRLVHATAQAIREDATVDGEHNGAVMKEPTPAPANRSARGTQRRNRVIVESIREMADAANRQGADATELRVLALHLEHGEIL